jgi:RNA polymerase subunit RPABC4/transcription elongation factor Spt4
MGEPTATARRIWDRARRDAAAHWQGAVVITAVAASDLAYRLFLRGQVRRALGMDARRV